MTSVIAYPSWLPGQDIYPDSQARVLIESAFTLAFPDGQADRRSEMLTRLLVELRSDATLVAAGLLVGRYRQEAIKAEDIKETCGETLYQLLQGLDALALIDNLHEREKSDLEQLRKMLLAMASDMRAVILKLALQVVAMRCMNDYSNAEQQRLALQTRDLFSPLANRLGIAQLKWELEDSALRVLEPDIYQELSDALEEKRVDRERYITRIIAQLEYALKKADIPINRIYGRVKHINSIYLKMKRKKLRFEQVNDIRAVRVEVETEEQCYQALSIVNDLWQPVPEEFDDYIANPKANGYQSLHSTLIGPENRMLEVQIRTRSMHERAELGVAAHWKYKEKGVRHSKQFEQQIEWLRRMLEGKGDAGRGDVIFDEFRNEAFRDRVYAVTPQGRVVDLPEGATPLDFAYHVHTQLGHRCKGAKINGQIVPLTTALKNGDTVEILTQKNANPSLDWLSEHLGYLQSGRAKAKVRSYFKKQAKEKSIELGKEMLTRELRRLTLSAGSPAEMVEIAKRFNVHSENDLYSVIGFGDIGVLTVAHEIAARRQAQQQPEQPSLDERLARIPVKAARRAKRQNIEVDGVDDLMVNFATCCQPIPPVFIKGFITLGRGINIHRADCPNIAHLGKQHPERIIDVHWRDNNSGLYQIEIAILAYDRPHVLRDISQVFANERIPILEVKMAQNDRSQLEGRFTLEISDMGQLSRVIDRLLQVKDVQQASRVQH
ncbi:RelA/SpoT family protein [Suttonella ornithocola]|uniref:GTP pyrophosphokinase n=1 Tax=Suttonella ornithocola TaxID=279832 RepID=A0A380MNI2_9GAMM|nr:bifunctional (p)ppGpp synthetase/guanosine-3',5'-bis(diphosphate) 3'-pyrophosphohydrolase [Suttonella ornithocola]SUO93734.1 GTP pyrophosphokinase [Suttonella ornithocola]